MMVTMKKVMIMVAMVMKIYDGVMAMVTMIIMTRFIIITTNINTKHNHHHHRMIRTMPNVLPG